MLTRFAGSNILLLVLFVSFPSICRGQIGPTSTPVRDLGAGRSGEDWPAFLGPRGDGKSAETGIITNWQDDGLRVLWHRRLQESYGICSVSHGRVFQFDRQNDKGTLLCLESQTGNELWRYTYDYDYRDLYGYHGGPRTSPLVDGDRVYLFGVDGSLICVGVADGKEIWKVDTHGQFGVVQNFFGVGSNPVIADDLIIVMVGGSPAESHRVPPSRLDWVVGNGSGIVAFNKLNGKVVYQITDELASYASLKLTHHAGRPRCFAFLRGGLTAFDPRVGKIDFQFPWRADVLESVNASMPVVFDGKVFISETYGPGSALLRFKSSGFEIVWKDKHPSRTKAMQTHWNTAIFHNGYLYGSSGRHMSNAQLRCIEANSGKVMWSEAGLTRSSLLYVDGHFVCLSEDGVLRLLKADPSKYTEVSRILLVGEENRRLLRAPAWAAPVLSHGLLYVRGDDRLVCTELIRPR